MHFFKVIWMKIFIWICHLDLSIKVRRGLCTLTKSLYGLKQANRRWNIKLTTTLVDSGYKQSHFAYSLFTKNQGDSLVVILIYVDDLLFTENDPKLILDIKRILNGNFKIKDLGDLRYFLRTEFARNEIGISCIKESIVLN